MTNIQALVTAIVVEVVIVLLVARRSYAMSQGVRYSSARLVILPAVIGVLWAFTELESLLLTPWALPYLVVVDTLILFASLFWFAKVAEQATEFYEAPAGVWNYRIPFQITVLFLVAFLVRLVLAVALFPSSLEFGPPPGGFPPAGQQAVLAVIDAIFSLSVGLLIGRTFGIRRKGISKGTAAASAPGPASP